ALTSSIIVPLQRASLPYRISQTRASLFVGRDREIAFLLESLEKGATSSPWIQLVGKPGVGKTRLLEEFKIQAEKRNWLVLKSGPHPSGTKVPYHALRELVAQLYDIATSQLGELEALEVIEDPNAQLGLKALVERDRNIGASPIALVRLLAALLMEGVLTALSRLNHCGVVLLIDDLHRCCNLTVRTIEALSKSSPQGLRIITSSVDPVEVCSSLVLHLEGLSDDEAALLLGDHQPIHPDAPRNSAASYASSSHHLPLAIEQYRALGAKSLDEIKRSPQRLADLVVLRLSQLNPDSLRLLQAIAVLGDRIHIDDLCKLYQAEININHTSNLIKTEWIQASGDELWFQHPLLREVIESNIPSQARKELHREVLLRCRSDAPLEVQAEHAWRAGLAERAIPLLEKSGDLALERGDAEQAQRDYQRALELAHDSWRSEGQELDEKHFIRLSRKLAKALLKNKKPLLAEGIVREALEGLAPQAIERAHLLVDLGRIAREREKKGEAVRLLNQAVEALERNKDLPMLVEGLLELALTLRSLGEKEPARQVAQRALEVAVGSASEPELTVRVALLNAEIAIDERRFEDAEEHLFLGFAVANRANLKVLLSRILALGAEVAEKNGLPQKARRLLEESIALARSSGNIDLAEELEVKSGAWSPDHPLD
ncbi:MAG: AAA family ATPase, partial [Deltaproteobacteria bacterium]|nr:AAA family ATPase [Deltaproteobacteria bacterium]